MYDLNEKRVNFTIKLSVEEVRKVLTYFEDEFMETYDEFLSTLESEKSDDNEEYEYYDEIRNILSDIVYDLHKELRKKERTSKRDKDKDQLESEGMLAKLSPHSIQIIKKIEESAKKIDPILLHRIYWYLHNSFDKSGEVIFTQNSLEDLLELDRYKLEKFLEQLSRIEITIGNKKGKIIEGYKFLNSTTVKINYSVYILNPHVAAVRDKDFHLNGLEKIAAQLN